MGERFGPGTNVTRAAEPEYLTGWKLKSWVKLNTLSMSWKVTFPLTPRYFRLSNAACIVGTCCPNPTRYVPSSLGIDDTCRVTMSFVRSPSDASVLYIFRR